MSNANGYGFRVPSSSESAFALNQEEMAIIKNWVDSIPLTSKSCRAFGPRNFSDGRLVAEIIHYYNPNGIHVDVNYVPSVNGRTSCKKNWDYLNLRIIPKLFGKRLSEESIQNLSNSDVFEIICFLSCLRKRLQSVPLGKPQIFREKPKLRYFDRLNKSRLIKPFLLYEKSEDGIENEINCNSNEVLAQDLCLPPYSFTLPCTFNFCYQNQDQEEEEPSALSSNKFNLIETHNSPPNTNIAYNNNEIFNEPSYYDEANEADYNYNSTKDERRASDSFCPKIELELDCNKILTRDPDLEKIKEKCCPASEKLFEKFTTMKNPPQPQTQYNMNFNYEYKSSEKGDPHQVPHSAAASPSNSNTNNEEFLHIIRCPTQKSQKKPEKENYSKTNSKTSVFTVEDITNQNSVKSSQSSFKDRK